MRPKRASEIIQSDSASVENLGEPTTDGPFGSIRGDEPAGEVPKRKERQSGARVGPRSRAILRKNNAPTGAASNLRENG
jgi:hypothetical protein